MCDSHAVDVLLPGEVEQGVFVLTKVVDHHLDHDEGSEGWILCVKWEGWRDPTWEPLDTVGHHSGTVKRYCRELIKKRKRELVVCQDATVVVSSEC